MRGGMRVLKFPGYAAVRGSDEGAESSGGPAVQWIAVSKRQGKQMISRAGCSGHPSAAAVRRSHDHTARSGNNCARLVLNKESIERGRCRRELWFPIETTVARAQNRTVAAHCPAISLIGGE